MPKRLEGLVVDEVSLVDVPANKGAKVILLKRDTSDMDDQTFLERLKKALGFLPPGAKKPGEDREDENDPKKKPNPFMSGDPKVDQKKFDELAASVQKLLDAETARTEAARVAKEAADKVAKEAADKAAAGKTEVEKSLDAAQKRAENLEAQVAALQEASEISKLLSGDLKDVAKGGNGDEIAKSVLKVRKADPAAAEVLVKQLKAQASQLATAGLFKTIGKDGGEEQSAEQKLEKMARKRAEDKGITYAVAYDAVVQENPDLYTETLASKE